jgi:(1->4)-alpha-D-glucan 1-alpha-D-glucosylmutase
MPEAWGAAVTAWSAMNERHRAADKPDRNAEYLLYQTLVGAWPLEAERAERYMEKAAREARTCTSWVAPNAEYEDALRGFVRRALGDPSFVRAVDRFTERLVAPGRVVSLAQTLLKLTAPGIPDLFQGTEIWSHVLVDPDNRRPVDYAARRALLDRAAGATAEDALAGADEGLPKLWLIRAALALRARRPAAFGAGGAYVPLAARGPKAEHAVAFARGADVISVVPRLVIGLGADWCGTTLDLPGGEWRNVLTDEPASGTVALQELLARFPVALLEHRRPD